MMNCTSRGLFVGLLLVCGVAFGEGDAPMGVERIARFAPLGYVSKPVGTNTPQVWLQVDLGKSFKIEKVKLFPKLDSYGTSSPFFPARFKLEASDDPEFKTCALIADQTGADVANPMDVVANYPAKDVRGRYVRLTVTKMHKISVKPDPAKPETKIPKFKFDLSKLEVFSGGKDVAEGCTVSDSQQGKLGATLLTRHPRPQGECVVTDNPGNVIPAEQWKPVAYKAQAPLGGVRLEGGVLEAAVKSNVVYLKPNPPGIRAPHKFWEEALAGSCAGRFLMGAGNSVRWMDHAELRARMNAIVDGIEECRQPNGFIMAYPENTMFTSERAAYTRAWLTHGLIDAGFAGNAKAFGLLRGYYDWFDVNPYLPELLRRGGQGVQGMIANARMYFTPVGKPQDLQVIQRYFQENYWLEQLAARKPEAIWQYPYDHPHNYLITSLEPYLDQYRATGKQLYLDAALGGWELYHDNWEHVGGSIAICEMDVYPPKSYLLHKHTGELCGSVFWVRYNQRFHLLNPDEEKYVNEIEKSIYNVGLADLIGTRIQYHTHLVGKKFDHEYANVGNTCCEGQGTRLYGSLPEYIYTLADDGLYVDLFAASSIECKVGGQKLQLKMETTFPFQPDVNLKLKLAQATQAKLRVRIPTWVAADVPVCVNGAKVATGKPGTYVVLDRSWNDGDAITFTLPMAFKLSHYAGAERVKGQEQYALEYGPILLAVVGPMDEKQGVSLPIQPKELVQKLKPQPGHPLHFAIEGDATHEYIPYWEVADQVFTCYPILGAAKP
ncbi:MAG: glycoside hydrolase family 127 protein [Kiritimatiellaeota bacterium]|nr:glycoside hydrolase family 127 protein [Kiritimatiellota bacterium]